MSKWHVIPLDEDQLMYAAIDVYVSTDMSKLLNMINMNSILNVFRITDRAIDLS